jgi:hypothetical protein
MLVQRKNKLSLRYNNIDRKEFQSAIKFCNIEPDTQSQSQFVHFVQELLSYLCIQNSYTVMILGSAPAVRPRTELEEVDVACKRRAKIIMVSFLDGKGEH